eukprot:6459488-Prymnesium_polylepis.1
MADEHRATAGTSAASASVASANSKSSDKKNQCSTAERRASRNAEKMKPERSPEVATEHNVDFACVGGQ